LLLFTFDGLSVGCTCLLSLDVKVILWIMLCNALEPRTSDGQGYM